MNFWENLQKPFTILAPMEGVTDFVFRQVMLKIGRPDVFFTEFTSSSGLTSKGFEKVARSLKFDKNEKPIVAQIWGTRPQDFEKAARICKKMGFSGIDLNMGCPIDKIVKKGACAALIKNKALAKEIILATNEGAAGLPVSIKTRIGFDKEEIDDWIFFLLEQNLPALTVHLRTAVELSKVDAHWELMPKILAIKDKISPKTLIIGNGDIQNRMQMEDKFKQVKVDGVMIGRGVFIDPWIFNVRQKRETSLERLNLYLYHINLFEKTWPDSKNWESLKKFSKMYVNNFKDATEYRNKINLTRSTSEMKSLIDSFIDLSKKQS